MSKPDVKWKMIELLDYFSEQHDVDTRDSIRLMILYDVEFRNNGNLHPIGTLYLDMVLDRYE